MLYQTVDFANEPILAIDRRGFCAEGTCRFCLTSDNQICSPTQGLKGERSCTNVKFKHLQFFSILQILNSTQ